MAPEQVRGLRAEPATDVYAFGAMLYELVAGKPVFSFEHATEAALAHATRAPEPPSIKAPRGWVTRDVDQFVLRLLAKEPERRPRDAQALLDAIESIGRGPASILPPGQTFSEETLTSLIDALIGTPEDESAATALEAAVQDGADPATVADAFEAAAAGVVGDDDDARAAKKGLLTRAGRTFDSVGDRARAEAAYVAVVDLDPDDVDGVVALEGVRKALAKYAEVVESLIARSESAAPGEPRARIFAEIGQLCATELEDPDQGILAYARALCETPSKRDLADEIERLAEGKVTLWNEVLATVTEGIQSQSLSPADRNRLLAYAGRWYEQKLGRADLARMAYQQVLTTDALNDEAHGGLERVYRKNKQWLELASALTARADATGHAPRARDMRSEAAELLEAHLNDTARAADLFRQVLAEDPGHLRAADGLAQIAERTGDYKTLTTILERRAEARTGAERASALVRVAEVFEQQLEDLTEAARRYEAALEIEPNETQALRGLDRIYNRTGKYRELLDNLQRQANAASTPRQKINVYERMATLYEEEFLDHARAAECVEEVLAIDAGNEAALAKLPRHYRALGQWEQLEELYGKHAAIAVDLGQRLTLLGHQARVLAENIGAPDRAMRVYERMLELEPGHAAALEAVAHLREETGDANAAIEAITALAEKATTTEARAEQWLRAARLLESRGDRDGAIERYKLAIEANPSDAQATAALRRAYAARGDAASVVSLIEKELELAEGRLARARLQAELARVFRDQLHDTELAEANARTAIELDSTNADALLVLGDIAYEKERYVEASRHLEPLVARAATLPEADAVRALVRFVEAFGRGMTIASGPSVSDRPSSTSLVVESNPRLAAAVAALERIAPDDAPARARVARVLFECGDVEAARRMYESILGAHADDLPKAERADAQWRLGESLRRLGELDKAVDLLREAAEGDPTNAGPLNALARVYEQTGDWEEFTRTKRRRLEVAAGAERFALLMEIGDAEFKKLGDYARAGKTYLAALDERPDDRKLLTKLMELFSEEKDWAALVDVVLRLADFVDDPKQRAKYMHTAAKVSARQLGDVDQAIEYYDRTLEFDPTLVKAVDEAIELRRQKSDFDGVERLLKDQLEQARQVQDQARMVMVLDRLGELYRASLGETELAIDAYEAAQAFDPEGKERTEVLAELYASDVTQYLDKAVRAQGEILRANPYRTESYKLLRKLYTESRRPDPAWCLCQALTVLDLAEPDEDRFYKRHRTDSAAPAQAVLEADDWASNLAHEDASTIVTDIFALIQPTIVRARTNSLEAMGYDPAYRVDLASQPYPVCQMLNYVQGVFGFEAPPVFQNPNDPAGLGFLHAHTPAIVLGNAAFDPGIPAQSLAFVAGRHMTYFRPGYYVRHLVPTGTGLKGWLFAAVKLCVPQFPIAQDLQGQVNDAMTYMTRDFHGVNRELLASLVSKLLQSGGAVDLKKWVAAIDLTADRAGFLVAHDLAVATEVIRATEDASSVSAKDRVKEAVLYSISTPYLELREKLQITIDS
jgi:tetratricopeptide (TPR) repeat protein